MLSRTATYALRAMAYLARRGGSEPVRAKTISEEAEIPKNFLSKILHRLVQEKLVRSIRGVGGGFVLHRPAREILLIDVLRPFVDLDAYSGCFLGRPHCDGQCGIHHRWLPIQGELMAMLEETTIEDIG